MHIHEYQAKELLRAYGIPTPQGRLARSHVEALEAARAMPGPVWVVKAQIHAGGRGKGGGVKICRSPEEVGEAAASLLGSRLGPARPGRAARPSAACGSSKVQQSRMNTT